MAVLELTLSEDGVAVLRDVLVCLSKFSHEVSLEAATDRFMLTALSDLKNAYASFSFSTDRFFSKYRFEGNAQFRDRFYCLMDNRTLMSIFRSRSGGDYQRDADRQSVMERCDVFVDDGADVKRSRFVAKFHFRSGTTATHEVTFETKPPVNARFDQKEAIHHWVISSRTLRQLMEHFSPAADFLEINSDGEHVNFTCFSEKSDRDDVAASLKKPLQTSIAVEMDEFEDIEVEDKLKVAVAHKYFRAVIQHAGLTNTSITARYSVPRRPIQLSYQSDVMNCEFRVMTFGERGSPGQKLGKRGQSTGYKGVSGRPELEAESRRTSVAPSVPPEPVQERPRPAMPQTGAGSASTPIVAPRASVSRFSNFDLRPSQRPPATLRSEGLFVDDDQVWEPMHDEEEEDDDARLGWDYSLNETRSVMSLSRPPPEGESEGQNTGNPGTSLGPESLEPTQPLTEAQKFGLFYERR